MKFIFIFFLILCNLCCNAQKYDNFWMLGDETNTSTVLDFTNNVMQIDTHVRNAQMKREGFCMSDSLGNLIFYTNGIKINNSNYQLMQNGDSLNPGQVANDFWNNGYPVTNSIISVPHPIQANKYYVFHLSGSYAFEPLGMGENLYYTIIDMNANNGLGRVETKNNIIATDSLINGGQLQTVKHANGRDWWLIQPMAWTNGYYIFLITEDTIELAHKQYIGNLPVASGQEWLGQCVFSPDGSRYVRYDFENDLDIFNFDRCTGLFSNPIHIPIQDTFDVTVGYFTGVAISPSSQYLYLSSGIIVYQFNLWSSNITTSKDTVAVQDGFLGIYGPTIFLTMQLAPDNKIYILSTEYYLHTIENPDSGGVSCNVQQRSVTTYNFLRAFFPNFPHYRTPALTGSPCDTLTSIAAIPPQTANINLYPNPATQQVTLEWQLEKAQNGNLLIFNALGQLIQQEPLKGNIGQQTISLNQYPSGLYFCKLYFDGVEVHQEKLIILK